MAINIDWDAEQLHQLLESTDGVVGRDLQRRALRVEAGQKRLLSMHGTGRVYDTGFFTDAHGQVHPVGSRAPHQASSPGRPPATDTGRLRATIGHRIEHDAEGLRADVGSGAGNAPGVKYAIYLERGTSKMEPRPFLRPSIRYAT